MLDHYFENSNQKLTCGWQICSQAPDIQVNTVDLESLPWISISELGNVATVLGHLKQWSLSSPIRRFDAEDWWYRLRFNIADYQRENEALLGFDGLATIAEVWLNGVFLFENQNMFLARHMDVSQLLCETENDLLIVFRSLDKKLEQRRPRPRWRVPMVEHQQLRWFRTTLLGRTPGWSPPVAVVGPWRDIWLAYGYQFRVYDLKLIPRVLAENGELEISCRIHCNQFLQSKIKQVRIVLIRNDKQYVLNLKNTRDSNAILCSGVLTIEQVDLWWPHTHGEPALYKAVLQVQTEDTGISIDFDLGKVGFRTLHLTQNPFSVSINGERIFCRGACWMPLDTVSLKTSSERYQKVLTQVRAAGMNMLRVGGTMIYEDDLFYTACAEQGIMLWQEFMFANMDYPNDASFIENALEEADQQLHRWQACPAITVLCGNSEAEQQAAMWGVERKNWQIPLFHEHLPQRVQQICPDVIYWPSSAHGGSFPHQPNSGTTSYYGIGAYLRELQDARRSQVNFATECLAFSNVPEASNYSQIPNPLGTIKVHHPAWKARVPRDLSAGWDFEDIRDYYLAKLFKLDPLLLRYSDHDRYILLSRLVSGEVMAATYNEWRSAFSSCQGALIWFLYDPWPGAGWGIIDSDGHPKAAYYYLKRVLQSISISVSDEGNNGLFIHVINEGGIALSTELNISVYQSGKSKIAEAKQQLELAPKSNVSYPLQTFFEQFMDLAYAHRFGPPIADAIHIQLTDSDNIPFSECYHFPLGMENIEPLELGLQAQAMFLPNGDAQVTIGCEKLALAVYFETDFFEAEDAYFHLLPGITKTVTLRVKHKPSSAILGYVGAANALNSIPIKVQTNLS